MAAHNVQAIQLAAPHRIEQRRAFHHLSRDSGKDAFEMPPTECSGGPTHRKAC